MAPVSLFVTLVIFVSCVYAGISASLHDHAIASAIPIERSLGQVHGLVAHNGIRGGYLSPSAGPFTTIETSSGTWQVGGLVSANAGEPAVLLAREADGETRRQICIDHDAIPRTCSPLLGVE